MASSAPSAPSGYEAPPPYPGLEKETHNQGGAPPAGMAYAMPQQPTSGFSNPNYPGPPAYPMTSSTTTNTVYLMPGQAVPQGTTVIVVPRNGCICPQCHVGQLVEESNALAICCIVVWAILFFPIGLLYLLCLPSDKVLRCSNCGFQGRH